MSVTTPARSGSTAASVDTQADSQGALTAAEIAGRRQRVSTRWKVTAAQVLIGVLILGAWEFAAATKLVNPILFSRPSEVAARLIEMLGGEQIYSRTIYDHLAVTLQAIVIGYAIGGVLAIGLGFLLGRVRALSRIFEPYILATYSIPKIAIAPLFILILGIGIESKIGVVAMEVFFIIFFNTFAGVIGVNEEHLQLARIMGATRSQVLRRIVIPSAMPSILLGLKMGVPFAMIGAIIGEFIASNQGLGWLILYSTSSFDASGLYASIAFLIGVTWILGALIGWFESRVLRWQPTQREDPLAV